MIIYDPNTSLEGNEVGGVWNQDAEHLLWAHTAWPLHEHRLLSIQAPFEWITTASHRSGTLSVSELYNLHTVTSDGTEIWFQGLYGPEFMLQAFNHLPKVRRTFPI